MVVQTLSSRPKPRNAKLGSIPLVKDWVFMHKESSTLRGDGWLPTEKGQYHLHWVHEGRQKFPTLSKLTKFLQQQVWCKKFPSGVTDWYSRADEDKSTDAEIVSKRTLAWQTLKYVSKKEKLYWRTIRDMYGDLPAQLEGFLLMDRFGNVIALEAEKGSLCYFTLEEDWVYEAGSAALKPKEPVRPVAEITNSSRLKSPSLYQAVVVKVFHKETSKIVDTKDYLLYMDLPRPAKGVKQATLGTAKVKELAYGVRKHHIHSIWKKACAAAASQPLDEFMSEFLVVLRLIFMCPWMWIPTDTSTSTPVHAIGKSNILHGLLHSPPPSSAGMSHISHDTPLDNQYNDRAPQVSTPSSQLSLPSIFGKARGSVDMLYNLLKGMSSSVLWLPTALSYVFPSGETGHFLDSPLYEAAVAIERAAHAAGDRDKCQKSQEDVGEKSVVSHVLLLTPSDVVSNRSAKVKENPEYKLVVMPAPDALVSHESTEAKEGPEEKPEGPQIMPNKAPSLETGFRETLNPSLEARDRVQGDEKGVDMASQGNTLLQTTHPTRIIPNEEFHEEASRPTNHLEVNEQLSSSHFSTSIQYSHHDRYSNSGMHSSVLPSLDGGIHAAQDAAQITRVLPSQQASIDVYSNLLCTVQHNVEPNPHQQLAPQQTLHQPRPPLYLHDADKNAPRGMTSYHINRLMRQQHLQYIVMLQQQQQQLPSQTYLHVHLQPIGMEQQQQQLLLQSSGKVHQYGISKVQEQQQQQQQQLLLQSSGKVHQYHGISKVQEQQQQQQSKEKQVQPSGFQSWAPRVQGGEGIPFPAASQYQQIGGPSASSPIISDEEWMRAAHGESGLHNQFPLQGTQLSGRDLMAQHRIVVQVPPRSIVISSTPNPASFGIPYEQGASGELNRDNQGGRPVISRVIHLSTRPAVNLVNGMFASNRVVPLDSQYNPSVGTYEQNKIKVHSTAESPLRNEMSKVHNKVSWWKLLVS
ncbi:hypothetical protein CEUSTIGMA_g9779.t1 [Chlamydomonas eustigma]|uniref:Uncharacterized protein n=1 Tax=Chlamydomonas eustigma TaxID=1157962 RepID=A0A250XHS4_9CHLO|nr:hypothetical protein CEUSTIGMA_g9779.t1 [Chlamydomonas eustigma]|eukprot:GAX82350.1 hypothetical protein CEUSTIGMA_g9779.t1 [Chlamydomonas eustigma]